MYQCMFTWSPMTALFIWSVAPQCHGFVMFLLCAQAITNRPTLFVEVLHNGSRVPIPGCQNQDSGCTLEAFLVSSLGLCCDYLMVSDTTPCTV